MSKNTARTDEPIWDSRNSDEPSVRKGWQIRDENHWAWWEYPLAVCLLPVRVIVLALFAIAFICLIPVGIIGAGITFLLKRP